MGASAADVGTAAAESPPESRTTIEQFRFTGSGGEYFRIWIVNLLLSVITLGIYSAWAKVRRMRYFYGNTHLAGDVFEYHGRPRQILKGRLIAFGLFLVYFIVSSLSQPAGFAMAIVFFFFVPWLAVKALSFRARMTSYRNIRFNFEQDHGGAAKVFIGFAMLVGVTLGLFFPYFAYARYRFAIDNTSYGRTRLKLFAGPGVFYWIYFRAVLLYIAASVIGVYLVRAYSGAGIDSLNDPRKLASLLPALLVVFVPLLLFVGAFLNKCLQNASVGNVLIQRHRLLSRLETGPLFWLYISNTVLIVLTLGLFIPWAHVRMAQYRFERLALEVDGSLDEFIAGETPAAGAAGDEISDMFDVDLGL
ncbi:MAG TPA: YjgN family protein [Steroidobacteraceae bacterium]|nr:YjgN family protein [Steroidobacteraceae bacterium]